MGSGIRNQESGIRNQRISTAGLRLALGLPKTCLRLAQGLPRACLRRALVLQWLGPIRFNG